MAGAQKVVMWKIMWDVWLESMLVATPEEAGACHGDGQSIT